MGKINVLSFAVANLIAAGEVVDRPSSVIKELVENAIDAGATRITVETQNGGVTLMRVTDNGCGMERDDLAVAVRRHATSKIKDETDLSAIMTLGFRGEALAAIAAVSDLRIISKTADAEFGSVIEVSGGVVIGIGDRAAQTGTTVMVENLFANVPARRKFLKKDVTETMAITAVVEKIALSHPEISFRLITDGSTRLETVGDGNLKSAVHSVFGRDFARALIEVNGGIDGIKVSGYCGRSDNCKVNRNFQNIFINGRYVKSRTAQAALEQAYVSYIPPEKFPVCILNIEINPALVDVNVHPSKLEVKFSNEKPVFEAVYYGVRAALEQNATRPEMQMTPPRQEQSSVRAVVGGRRLSDMTEPIRDGREESLKRRQLGFDVVIKPVEPENKPVTPISALIKTEEPVMPAVRPAERPVSVQAPEPPTPKIEEKPIAIISSVEERSSWRIVGEAFNSYIIVERGEKLILIDKHAAHERVIFEDLKAAEFNEGRVMSQQLLLPISVSLDPNEISAASEYRNDIEVVGFSYFINEKCVDITAIPNAISIDEAEELFVKMLDEIIEGKGNPVITDAIRRERALYQIACKAAIKGGRRYDSAVIDWLVSKLLLIPDITVCPHGRPVAYKLEKRELDRNFDRIK